MTDTEAVLQLIKEEPGIETLLGHFQNPEGDETAFPMAVIGTFPEVQTNLPAISIRKLLSDNQFGITTSRITVSCYAETSTESMEVATAVNDLFRDSQGGVSGFSARYESSITGTVNDADQSGTIVELILTYR